MIEKIESLRRRLDEAIENDNIKSEEVLKISMELDELISQYYSIKKEEVNQE